MFWVVSKEAGAASPDFSAVAGFWVAGGGTLRDNRDMDSRFMARDNLI